MERSNQKYPPIGQCIYCGSDGGVDGLRDEHIVPYSLGGHAELKEASCRSCEKITSYMTGIFLGMFSISFDRTSALRRGTSSP
jgi:5-methylcytosine-specific restriction endonuclease McrA